METNPHKEDAPQVPPVVRPEKVRRKAVWPLVLGIIGLAFAAMQIFGLGMQFVLAAAGGFEFDGFVRSQFPGLKGGLLYVGIALMILNLVILASLVTAGVGLISRKRWGISSARFYAVASFVIAVLATALNVINFNELQNNPEFQNIPQGIPIQSIMIIGLAIGLLVAFAISLGILLWLHSKAARREWTTWS